MNSQLTNDQVLSLFGADKNKASVLNITKAAKHAGVSEHEILRKLGFHYSVTRDEGTLWAVVNLDKPVTKPAQPKPYYSRNFVDFANGFYFVKKPDEEIWLGYQDWCQLEEVIGPVRAGKDSVIVTAKAKHVGTKPVKFGRIIDGMHDNMRHLITDFTVIINGSTLYRNENAIAQPGDSIQVQITLKRTRLSLFYDLQDALCDILQEEPLSVSRLWL